MLQISRMGHKQRKTNRMEKEKQGQNQHTSTHNSKHIKLRQLLLNPNDKKNQDQKCKVRNEKPCHWGNKTLIEEYLLIYIKKNIKKEKETSRACTRATEWKTEHESEIPHHCKKEMDWDKARIIGTEDNRHRRWIKEAIKKKVGQQGALWVVEYSKFTNLQWKTAG